MTLHPSPIDQADKYEMTRSVWSDHWSEAKQKTVIQRLFGVYRREVISRLVQYCLSRHFPTSGVFLEAGSGTSETSRRIDRKTGRRLIALDVVLGVLRRCDPVMDEEICADIFRLPFRDNCIDGIWNVGVMEHFSSEQIDQILREFFRVLRPGSRVVLFWPAVDSAPQLLLRQAERLINLRNPSRRFRFHPDEISQLRSGSEGDNVLVRNRFHVVNATRGLANMLGFTVLVGSKPAVALAGFRDSHRDGGAVAWPG